jgi:hypothetical protein
VGLERGRLSLVSTTEELLERESSGSSLESREYGRRDPSRWPRGTLYPQKLVLISSTSGGRSVGMVCSRNRGTEFSYKFTMTVKFSVGQLGCSWKPKWHKNVTQIRFILNLTVCDIDECVELWPSGKYALLWIS